MALGRSNCRRTPPAVQYRTRRWFPPTIFFSTSLFSWGSTMIKSYEIPGVPTGISKIMALVFANCFCSRTWAPLAATTTRLLGLNMFKREGMSDLVGRHRGTIYIYIQDIHLHFYKRRPLLCCIYIDVSDLSVCLWYQTLPCDFHWQNSEPIYKDTGLYPDVIENGGSSCRDDYPN